MFNRERRQAMSRAIGGLRCDQQILELIRQPALRWADVPGGDKLVALLSATPDDPHLADLTGLLLQQQLEKASASNDPFYANYPPPGTVLAASPGILIGMMPAGEWLPLPLDSVTRHLGVFGRTGSGKTTLVKGLVVQLVTSGMCVVVIDQKRSWRGLVSHPGLQGKVHVLKLKDLKLNLVQPPANVDDAAAANHATMLIAQGYGRISAQRLLREVVGAAMARRAPGMYPTLDELIGSTKEFQPGRGFREAEYRESILWTLTDLHNQLHVFNYSSSNLLECMFSKSQLVVIEAEGLPAHHMAFLADHMQHWCYQDHLSNPGRRSQPVCFVLEDATAVADAQRDWDTPGRLSLLAQRMLLARELNIGLILVSHMVGSVSDKILHNAESFVVCALQGEDERLIQRLLGTTPEQTAAIRILQPGQAVASVPSMWPLPVLVSFPPLPDTAASEEECERTAEEFLRGVVAVGPAARPTPEAAAKPEGDGGMRPTGDGDGGATLRPEAIRLMILCATPVPAKLTDLYSQVGVRRARGVALVAELESKGLVKLHRFATSKPGGRLSVIEVTESGWSALARFGVERPKVITRGSWEHNMLAAAIGQAGRREGYEVAYEQDIGGVCVDVRWRRENGDLVYFQVGVSSP